MSVEWKARESCGHAADIACSTCGNDGLAGAPEPPCNHAADIACSTCGNDGLNDGLADERIRAAHAEVDKEELGKLSREELLKAIEHADAAVEERDKLLVNERECSARMRSMLKRIQWASNDSTQCYFCCRLRFMGHSAYCELAKAIG